ncbi:trypsin-like serine peptidase [Microbacterium invictum]|uniref:V8-like Glu-specific endopeptidase n=1 Tax=Microbacterium invictum TaxID=515415 RepID=A0AA40SPR7_9MICO|nr:MULTISPECIES: trypsin-like serine protease [Microbacterium]MBB4140064.1 V8-like Glu-specific endopeptidase [Microbacterium invictum]
MDTNTKGGAPAPLTDRKLSAGMDIRRHEPPAAEAMVARFDITTDTDATPEVTLDRAADGRWRFSVSVARGQTGSIERAAPELVKLDRRTLVREAARMDERELAPSIPVGLDDVTIRPRLARGKLRRGELSGERKVRPTTVFAPDGRSTYYDTSYPWRCLVRMTRPSGWSGSGVLIGPRHVLTASHCVDWTPGWLRVDVLYTNGSSLASAHGTWAYYTRQVTAANYSSTNMDDDYAVIVLDQRLGDRYGWFGARTYSDSWDGEVLSWRNLGYPQDFSRTGDLATYQRDFALDETDYDSDSGRVLESSTFDNWPGQSGGPVFGFWDHGPYVVGVVSGESSSDNFVAGGSPLTGLVRRARTEHP